MLQMANLCMLQTFFDSDELIEPHILHVFDEAFKVIFAPPLYAHSCLFPIFYGQEELFLQIEVPLCQGINAIALVGCKV